MKPYPKVNLKIVTVLIAGLALAGCGPSKTEQANEEARQARQDFRQIVAALKVSADNGCTYSEFRERRLALETCWKVNGTLLLVSYPDQDYVEFYHLADAARDTDILWREEIQFGDMALWPHLPGWDCAVDITPRLANKTNLTVGQMDRDPDFHLPNLIRRGLAKVSSECDKLLK